MLGEGGCEGCLVEGGVGLADLRGRKEEARKRSFGLAGVEQGGERGLGKRRVEIASLAPTGRSSGMRDSVASLGGGGVGMRSSWTKSGLRGRLPETLEATFRRKLDGKEKS